MIQGHTSAPPPGFTASVSPAVAPAPAPAPQQAPSQPTNYRPTGPSPAPSMPQPYPQQQHGESSRTGSYNASPRAPSGVLGGLMQTFDTAKSLGKSSGRGV